MRTEPYDVAIIGGGPAGLAAALVLGRSRKRVVLLDGGPPRNARAQYIGGFITQDRIAPAAFRATAHEDLRAYPTIDLHLNTIALRVERGGAIERDRGAIDRDRGAIERDRGAIERDRGAIERDAKLERFGYVERPSLAFTIDLAGTDIVARRVLLATGLVDEPLPLEGSRELWGRSLFQCPYCHAYEHRDKKLAFLAPNCDECDWSLLLRSWSRDVTVFTNGAYQMSDEHRTKLTEAGVPIEDARIVGFVREGDRLLAVRLEGSRDVACDALFFRPQQRHVSAVARLGLALTVDGYVRVDQNFQTSMPGIYAAGDLATHYHGALAAAAAGSQAAHSINRELTEELVVRGHL
jgi:thioredoxin reductase